MSIEQWAEIHGCRYDVSTLGRMRNRKTGRILKQANHKGYRRITLKIGGHLHSFRVHRLVAEAFIPNPNNFPEVNHKDCNKANNNVDNLEWCTHKENLEHASGLGLLNWKLGRKQRTYPPKSIKDI